MLNSLRKASSGLVAKIMLGILALSFAVWGATDIFTGSGGNVLSKVGNVEISGHQFSSRFQRDLLLSAREDKSQTKALKDGFALRIYRTMESEAALDNQLQNMNISLPAEEIAREIVNLPAFQNINGEFDRLRFDQYLRASGLSESGFLETERKLQMRTWIQRLVSDNNPVSKTMVDALATYQYQKRVAKYFILPENSIGSVKASSEEELKKIYEKNESRFALPEYRKVTLLEIDPRDIQSSIEITDAQIEAEYNRNKRRYITPETRTIDQIPFSDEASAQAAYEKLQKGESFKTIANQQGFEGTDFTLSNIKKSDIADEAIADAAFAIEKGVISKPIKGQLSHMILRVTDIAPGKTTPLSVVKKEITQQLQFDQAQEQIQNRHDEIEDARGEGMTFDEIANKFNLELIRIPSIDARGFTDAGTKAKLPKNGANKLIAGIFDSDIGLENDPVSTADDGYIWYEVEDVKKSRQKSFEESKAEVIKLAGVVNKQKLLKEKASALVKKSDDEGKSFAWLAASVGAKVQTSSAITRFETGSIFSSVTNSILFATPQGEVSWATGISDMIVMKTEKIIEPKLAADSAEVKRLQNGISQQLQSDIGNAYISALVQKYPIERNTELWQSIQDGTYGTHGYGGHHR